jgi:hypothetical protein
MSIEKNNFRKKTIIRVRRINNPFCIVFLPIFVFCHMTWSQEKKDMVVTPQMRTDIIEKIISELSRCYINPETAINVESRLREGLKRGEYDHFTDLSTFLKELRMDLRDVSKDRHLGVWPIWFAPVPKGDSEEDRREFLDKMRYENYGFHRIERLEGNIGYLKLDYFADPEYGKTTAAAAMTLISNCDAVIIDLRENHGGSEHMVNYICAYFFDEPVHTISMYTRYKDITVHLWTPEIPNPWMKDKPLFILQSHESASGAEHFSYSMKAVNRAIIVGETSRGAANPVEERIYPNLSLNIALPVSRAIHPITETDWEGTGVEPDIKVPEEEALKKAHLVALETLVKQVPDEKRRKALRALIQKMN